MWVGGAGRGLGDGVGLDDGGGAWVMGRGLGDGGGTLVAGGGAFHSVLWQRWPLYTLLRY